MDSNYEDSDDSSIFLKSLGQKRKASDNINKKNFKQVRFSLPKSQNSQTDNKEPDVIRGNSKSDDDIVEIIEKEETKSLKTLENDSETNESISSYFDEKRRSNTCPLCFKLFEMDSGYAMHMKQCAKKRKMTTQQLLTAIELQMKQAEERKALGLPSQIVAPKKSISKKKVKEDAQSDYDLALGLALSKSLDPKESQKSTLQEFGFTYSGPGPSKKKVKDLKKWILKERTQEERQRIVTEKAAVVLLDEDEENNSGKVAPNRNSCRRNDSLTKFQNREPRLWNVAEDEEHSEWYVNNMKELMRIEEEDEDKEKEKEKEEGDNPRRTSITQENLTREIEKLKLPKERILLDWKKMINSNELSDLFERTKDSKTVYMHSLVFYARCPDVLKKDHESIFSKHLLSTILIFLEYLYCGTLNGLTTGELDNVSKLAFELNYRELVNVLNRLKKNLTGVESSEEMIPSSLTPDEEARSEDNEIAIVDVRGAEREDEEVTIVPEEKDLFEEEIDLTHGSPAPDEREKDEMESNADKSYWSFVQERRREKLKAELRRKEEEREKSMISFEMEKIKTSMEQQNEMLQKIYDEFEEEETDFKRVLEIDAEEGDERGRSPTPPRSENRSEDSATKDLFEDVKSKEDEDCIVLSSDSESRASKGEEEDGKSVPVDVTSKPETHLDYEAPLYDPYDNFNDFSECDVSPVTQHSQSLVSEIAPFSSPLKKTSDERGAEEVVENRSKGPEYFSTPVTKRQPLSRINSSSEIKSREKKKKRTSALGTSVIIRKSLGLTGKLSRCSLAKKKSMKSRKSYSKQKDLANVLTDSVLSELSTSLMPKTSTPVQNRFIEMTPRTTRDVDFGESVTPDPNFSNMGESMLKEHLSKYGLKKSLAKTKARKILRHIYEELHPILNTETGKLVKIVPSDNPRGQKKGKPKKTEKKPNSTKPKKQKKTETATATKEPENNINDSLSKHPDLMSDGSIDSFERSTDHDSERSEFEDIQEPMTQSVPNNPVDLPSALNEFLNRNPEFHQKILLYEPIWLEDLQRQLKEVFRKHFKLSDLMDYLDQKCITFRSEAQKKTNERKNQKTKKSKQTKEKKELL